MAANISPIYAQAPVISAASLVGSTPITSRADIVGTTGLTLLAPTTGNGKRIDKIRVKSKGTSVASELFIWLYDGTTARLIDEIDILAATPTNTLASNLSARTYTDLGLQPGSSIYISQTVATDVTVTAHGGDY